MRNRHRSRVTAVGLAAATLVVSCAQLDAPRSEAPAWNSLTPERGEWITWGGDLGNTRYSPLDQIARTNVAQLRPIWRWRAESLPRGPDTNWKATPIYIDGVLYVPTGGSKVAAIDPATGATIWLFTPDPLRVGTRPFSGSSRAVSYWTDGTKKRILHNSIDGRLFSIDASTGQLDPGFGSGGVVNLNENLLDSDDTRKRDDMGSTGPGIVVGDVIVVQVIGNDSPRRNEGTPGYIRGYDIRTGKMLWKFHTIPRAGEFGVETWANDSWRTAGAASVWSMMAADPELGYVYLPVESATNNFWGGQRPGDGLFGESIVCLDAKTGKRVWHFQIVHHGVWDYDLPAAPILHNLRKDGKTIKAVTVLTKQGMSFVFDRVTGAPVWPIEERPVPTSMGVPGEKLSPTQPFPTKPAPYSKLGYHEEDVIDFTPELRAEALKYLEKYVKGPMYTPPTLVGPGIATQGTLVYPNFGGGANWNGGAVDMETNVMFVPTRNTFMAVGLRKADPKLTDWEYVVTGGDGARPLRLPSGLPVNRPPWSLVTATDMNRGEHVWTRSIGGAADSIRNHPALKGLKLDFDSMGQISVRPSPLVTKSLLFLAESANIGGDPGGKMFRAYDKASGKVVAEIELPAKTSGAPMTYLHNGRQYIAIALSEQKHPAELVVLSVPRAGDSEAILTGGAGSSAPLVRERVEASTSQLQAGAALYGQSCAACHGARGEGVTGSNAPALMAVSSLDDVKNVIARGSAEMPAMSAVLTPEQIDAVSRYVLVELTGAR
jgi:glucose dehydrogenase/cytochrome c5